MAVTPCTNSIVTCSSTPSTKTAKFTVTGTLTL
jgi:hypothetical protein